MPFQNSMYTSEETVTIMVNGEMKSKPEMKPAPIRDVKISFPPSAKESNEPNVSDASTPVFDPLIAELQAELAETKSALSEAQNTLSIKDLANVGLAGELDETRKFALGVQAEYSNYSKRVNRDRDLAKHLAIEKVATDLLPVLDDIVAARAAGDLQDGPFAAISNKLEFLLGNYGLVRIDEIDVPFDPTIHEALLRQPSENIPAESVSMMLRPGYIMGERLIRAAQVAVSAGK